MKTRGTDKKNVGVGDIWKIKYYRTRGRVQVQELRTRRRGTVEDPEFRRRGTEDGAWDKSYPCEKESGR